MEHEGELNPRSLTNETVLSTPTPAACSTGQRQNPSKLLSYRDKTSRTCTSTFTVRSSNVSNTAEASTVLNFSHVESLNERLQKQKSLASNLLQKSTKTYRLPSHYLKSTDTPQSVCNGTLESTVNESDLLFPNKNCERMSFVPQDISTPRPLCVATELEPRTPPNKPGLVKNLTHLSKQIENSDTSLKELFEEFYKCDDSTMSLDCEESFLPGELALARIAEHERLWQKDCDILAGNNMLGDSAFENASFPSSRIGESSLGEFFKKRSQLADLCFKVSPERKDGPTPLIEQSIDSLGEDPEILANSTECSEISNAIATDTFDLSELENAISLNDNTAQIMDFLGGKQTNARKQPNLKSVNAFAIDNYKENAVTQTPTNCCDPFNMCKKRPRVPEPLRENRRQHDDSYRSLVSVRTSSSLDSLPGGKLPIETNRIELVWGCVSAGKKQTRTFISRNRSQNKLRLQLSISNTNFKIVNEQHDYVQVLAVCLRPSESRTFTVVFSPLGLGAVVGKLDFSPIDTEMQKKQTKRQHLYLYGYGGGAHVEIQGVPKDSNSKMWLALGRSKSNHELNETFILENWGTLPAFVHLEFKSKSLVGYSKIDVRPSQAILRPKERVMIAIVFTPNSDDVKHILASDSSLIVEIGHVHLVTGEESLRGRIRRLAEKLKHEGGVLGNPLVERLCGKFQNERVPSDLVQFTESVGCMKELMRHLVSKEIVLTVEKDAEEHNMMGVDDTSMFHSLAEGTASSSTIFSSSCFFGSACRVEPTCVVLTPPIKVEDRVVITNSGDKQLQFETAFSVGSELLLRVSPADGVLRAGESKLIKISCDCKTLRRQKEQQRSYKLSIYVDNDVFDVSVKIILVPHS